MESLTIQDNLVDFLNDPENAQRVDDLVEDISYALMDYQVCTATQNHLIIPNILSRLHCGKTSITRAVKKL